MKFKNLAIDYLIFKLLLKYYILIEYLWECPKVPNNTYQKNIVHNGYMISVMMFHVVHNKHKVILNEN